MESWNRLTTVRGEEGGRDCLKEGEGTSQRTYMKGPWKWTILWGWIMEVWDGLGGGWGKGGKLGQL